MLSKLRHILPVVVMLLAGLTSSLTLAEDLPKRKSGLWELKMTTANMPAGMGPMQTCVDEKSDDLTQQQTQGQMKKACGESRMQRDGDRVLVHSVCRFDKFTTTTDAVFTGHFDSSYRGDIKTTFNPPMAGRKETQMIIEAKWLGPCKAGQKPGDVMINGQTVSRAATGAAGQGR